MYKREVRIDKKKFIDSMKVGTDQWEYKKNKVVVQHVGKGVIV